MTVITKEDEKVSTTASALGEDFSPDEFVEKFKELHSKDWGKLREIFVNMSEINRVRVIDIKEPTFR